MRVLIANRGEIAVRIVRAVQELGGSAIAVYSELDRGSLHVGAADQAVLLSRRNGDPYLDIAQIVEVALAHGATAVHPGYGFLSENAGFAEAVEAAGLIFVGPRPAHIAQLGDKQQARACAAESGVPMAAATVGLTDASHAREQIAALGLPVVLKAAGGGGGRGMAVVDDLAEVEAAYETVRRVAESLGGGVYAERFITAARHIEVQIFGDGQGRVITLGDRDCTLQRRNQKVVEEAPAPALDAALRQRLHDSARALGESLNYRNAGTVEFVVDAATGGASFLEVNTRLQVEHPVTEAVTGVDLVQWMLRLAFGDDSMLDPYRGSGAVPVNGWAVESRLYAEDPANGFRPSPGVVTQVRFPEDARIETWIAAGTEVGLAFDPMVAKIITAGDTRESAWRRHRDALADTAIGGLVTNLGLLRVIAASPLVADVGHTTSSLGTTIVVPPADIEVLDPGLLTTVQEAPGRVGLWHIGVPPSGPMDQLSFALGNVTVGNPEGTAGLECTVVGPRLRFGKAAVVCVAGAPAEVHVDGRPVPMWEPVDVPAGGVLAVGRVAAGVRTYVLVAGGIDVPPFLGSRATFTLGAFGGLAGRKLRVGDALDVVPAGAEVHPMTVPGALRPSIGRRWDIGVLDGPHSSPDFFTEEDIDVLFGTEYQVHFNSDRTGVRLVGPKPTWARSDGGEAGLHPSNIHDTAYVVGGLDFTGDTAVLLGPDGPSLGGFVNPVTVVRAELWKLGQLAPGDTVRFVRREPLVADLPDAARGVLSDQDGVVIRRQGDAALLVEFGPAELDVRLRVQVHLLHRQLVAEPMAGLSELTPGIRSIQLCFARPDDVDAAAIAELLRRVNRVVHADDLVVPSRRVRLPLSWDDPATREAIARYEAGVRADAPWCPWNIEFIRRINGLDTVEDVFKIVFDAEYLVMGLGDVYLGAPVATPLDPRHRLVTTKYSPARTWTAENSVGIGGAYLCVYGMEGPGGYQFVGRTTQVWDRWHSFAGDDRAADGSRPWLLDYFDRISWYEVSAEELLHLRADFAAGRWRPEIEPGELSLAEYADFLDRNADTIETFRDRQQRAFAEERERWAASGEFDPVDADAGDVPAAAVVVSPDCTPVVAPLVANVWKLTVEAGAQVAAGDVVAVLEAMKMETAVVAGVDGVVAELFVGAGATVNPGDPIMAVRTAC
jgi:urea carboxylase